MKLVGIFGVIVTMGLCPWGAAQHPVSETGAVARSVSATIEANERGTWEAFKAGDEAAYRALCCAEFCEISANGELHTLDDIARGMRTYVTKGYVMEDVVVTRLADNVFSIRYKLTVDYVEGGKALPTKKCRASAVWIKREEKWLAASYQESRFEE